MCFPVWLLQQEAKKEKKEKENTWPREHMTAGNSLTGSCPKCTFSGISGAQNVKIYFGMVVTLFVQLVFYDK